MGIRKAAKKVADKAVDKAVDVVVGKSEKQVQSVQDALKNDGKGTKP